MIESEFVEEPKVCETLQGPHNNNNISDYSCSTNDTSLKSEQLVEPSC